MSSLNEILTTNNKAEIKLFANKFGFGHVRIFCVPEEETLNLLVANDPKQSGHYDTAFEAILRNKFNCVINVIVESTILSHEKNNVLQNSVDIEDIQAIEKIYKKSQSDIKISSLSNEDKNDNRYTRGLKLAESILNPNHSLKKNNNHLFGAENKNSDQTTNKRVKFNIQDFENDFFEPANAEAAKRTIEKISPNIISELFKVFEEEKKQIFNLTTNKSTIIR
jgi:hypothetical protein